MVPEALETLLRGFPDVDTDEQAFPLLTVDEHGFPHTALLSRAELDVAADASAVHAVIASVRTVANLRRDRRAALIAVGGDTAHYVKLRVVRMLDSGGVLGVALDVVEHKADSVGIPLRPMGFRTSAEVAHLEHWELSRRVLERLAQPDA